MTPEAPAHPLVLRYAPKLTRMGALREVIMFKASGKVGVGQSEEPLHGARRVARGRGLTIGYLPGILEWLEWKRV